MRALWLQVAPETLEAFGSSWPGLEELRLSHPSLVEKDTLRGLHGCTALKTLELDHCYRYGDRELQLQTRCHAASPARRLHPRCHADRHWYGIPALLGLKQLKIYEPWMPPDAIDATVPQMAALVARLPGLRYIIAKAHDQVMYEHTSGGPLE